MNSTAFAPEPLFVKDYTSKAGSSYHGTFDIINRASYGEKGAKNIAHVIPYGGERFCTHEEAKAYAKLFAAAPDMLAYIKELIERYPNSPWIADRGKEIIAKATT